MATGFLWHMAWHRIGKAARLLKETSLTPLDVALRVGYRDPERFERAFTHLVGETPRAYRRRAWSG